MNKLRWLLVLMGITIAGVAAFQFYWLRQNYGREKKTLGIKTDVAFRETVMQLQVENLKLDISGDSLHDQKFKFFKTDSNQNIRLRFAPREKVISSINVMRDKIGSQLRKDTQNRKGVMITLNQRATMSAESDSVVIEKDLKFPGDEKVFHFLYSVDSLQDSISVKELTAAFATVLDKQEINVPFSITKLDTAEWVMDQTQNTVTVGFANPISYQLNLGNTFSYLIKKISLPILFSFLLLGITILSFTLLYRNLLKQQRLTALKNEFIGNITHELKTPVATVGVAIEALKNFNAMQDQQRTKEYLDISSLELQRLSLLVDKVLRLSMFENKGISLKFEKVDLKTIVDEVIASFKLQLEKNKAEVHVTTEGNTTITGDKLHLMSVIFNLVDNALKYSREEPQITIDIKETNEEVVISIMDNGIGVPKEYREKIFDKFFRVPHGDTHDAKGYGLGLSYVAQVINGHNGNIHVDGEAGRGSVFVITLPKEQRI